MSADTLMQIQQVRDGHINDFHTPALLSLWHVAWRVLPGTWYVLAGCVTLFVVAVSVLLRPVVPPVGAAVLAGATAVSPMLLGFLGVLSRDTWLMALTLAAFAAVMAAAARRGRPQRLCLAAALLLATLAMAARQNAVPIVFAVCLTALMAVASRTAWRRALVISAGVTLLLAGLQTAWVKVVVRPAPTHPEQAVFIYDTIEMSVREGKVLLPPEVYPAQDVELLRRYTSVGSVNANFHPPVNIPFPMSAAQADALKGRWWRAVRDDPWGYVETRLALGCEQISLCARVRWVQHPLIDQNPWGYRPTFPALEHLANRYVGSFAANPDLDGGMVFTVWAYLLVDLGGLLYLLHRDPRRRVVGGLALAAVLYEATIVLASPENQYRFSLLAVATGLVIAVTALGDVTRAVRRANGPVVSRADESDRFARPAVATHSRGG